jgi:hypothetical protein
MKEGDKSINKAFIFLFISEEKILKFKKNVVVKTIASLPKYFRLFS